MLTFEFACVRVYLFLCMDFCSLTNSFASFVIIVALLHAMDVLSSLEYPRCLFNAMFAQIDVHRKHEK